VRVQLLVEDLEDGVAGITSMKRTPGAYKNFVRGTSTGVPFAPGGLEDVALNLKSDAKVNLDDLLKLDDGWYLPHFATSIIT
jgi:hypothetical protein